MNKYQKAWDKILNRRETLFGNSNTVRDILVNLPTQESLILEVNMIKELVEKATPKKIQKPMKKQKTNTRCPQCDSYVQAITNSKYCGNCGQALDWSRDDYPHR